MNLKWVWFDLGYTLVYLKRESHFQNAIKALGIYREHKDIHYGFHLTDKLFMRDYKGYLAKERDEFMPLYMKKLFEFLHIKDDECNINKVLMGYYYFQEGQEKEERRKWHAYKDSKNVLAMLKNDSKKVGLISNWDMTARNVLKVNELYDFFDEIVISSEVNIEKPRKEIFDIAMKRTNAIPKECLYVGDNYYDDAVGSSRIGMNSVIINSYELAGIEEVKNVDIIPNIRYLPEYIKRIENGSCEKLNN